MDNNQKPPASPTSPVAATDNPQSSINDAVAQTGAPPVASDSSTAPTPVPSASETSTSPTTPENPSDSTPVAPATPTPPVTPPPAVTPPPPTAVPGPTSAPSVPPPSTPVSVDTASSPDEDHKGRGSKLILVIVGILLVLAIIGGYFLYVMWQQSSEPTTPSPTNNPAPTVASEAPEPTAEVTDEVVDSLNEVSSSDEIDVLETDLENSDFEALDEELELIEQEL